MNMNIEEHSNRFRLENPIEMDFIGLAHRTRVIKAFGRDLPIFYYDLSKTIYEGDVHEYCRKVMDIFHESNPNYKHYFSVDNVAVGEFYLNRFNVIGFVSVVCHDNKEIYHNISIKGDGLEEHSPSKSSIVTPRNMTK